ncbi:MAG TPA: CopD family protein, partial [Sporolactobacillaceae bacterium]|nr:CopD family protein [Sporolactobacillaceae bacterium]
GQKKSAVPEIPSNLSSTSHSHGGFQFLFYGAYYILFLAFSGWILIGLMRPKTIANQKVEWYKALKFFYLITCILLTLTEYVSAVSGFDKSRWSTFFFHTSTGIIAGVSVALAILAQFILQKNRMIDGIWFLAVILLEAYNGHAATFAPVPVTVGLDAIHLIGAAFWVGGLVYLVIHFRNRISEYLSFFSKWALISLVVLVISGTITTLIFTPDLPALTKSTWGILLIIKVFAVLLVYLTAAIIRSRLKAVNPRSTRSWLKVDVAMMVIILMIVGGMTRVSPFPTNDPVEWKTSEMGYDVSTLVYPTNPGSTNTFSVTVSSLTRGVQNVELILRNEDKKDLAPFHIPLKRVKTNPKKGETLATYAAKGAFISIPGTWQLEIQIYDQKDNYTIVKKNITVYKIKQ